MSNYTLYFHTSGGHWTKWGNKYKTLSAAEQAGRGFLRKRRNKAWYSAFCRTDKMKIEHPDKTKSYVE